MSGALRSSNQSPRELLTGNARSVLERDYYLRFIASIYLAGRRKPNQEGGSEDLSYIPGPEQSPPGGKHNETQRSLFPSPPVTRRDEELQVFLLEQLRTVAVRQAGGNRSGDQSITAAPVFHPTQSVS